MKYISIFTTLFCLLVNISVCQTTTEETTPYTYIADRPQLTTSGVILPVKTFAIETGFRANIIDQDNYSFNYNQTLVRIGMMKLMEMTVGFRVPGTLSNGNHEIGFASPKAGLKVLMKEKGDGNMGLAFVGEAGINFGTKNFKDTKVLPAFRVAMDIDLSDKTNMRINYGAEWRENLQVLDTEGNPAIDPFFVVALNVNQQFSDKITAFVEVYANVKHNNFRNDYFLNGGLIYKMKSNVQLDFAAGAGLSPNSPRGNVQIGFSGIWPKKNIPQ
ncbi:MAG: transporter [Chitinophagales bacterium]